MIVWLRLKRDDTADRAVRLDTWRVLEYAAEQALLAWQVRTSRNWLGL